MKEWQQKFNKINIRSSQISYFFQFPGELVSLPLMWVHTWPTSSPASVITSPCSQIGAFLLVFLLQIYVFIRSNPLSSGDPCVSQAILTNTPWAPSCSSSFLLAEQPNPRQRFQSSTCTLQGHSHFPAPAGSSSRGTFTAPLTSSWLHLSDISGFCKSLHLPWFILTIVSRFELYSGQNWVLEMAYILSTPDIVSAIL